MIFAITEDFTDEKNLHVMLNLYCLIRKNSGLYFHSHFFFNILPLEFEFFEILEQNSANQTSSFLVDLGSS